MERVRIVMIYKKIRRKMIKLKAKFKTNKNANKQLL